MLITYDGSTNIFVPISNNDYAKNLKLNPFFFSKFEFFFNNSL